MHVSLKDLFAIVSFVAILAWCVAQVGFDNLKFWVNVAAICLLSIGFVFLAGGEKRRWAAPIVAAPGILCACMLPGGSFAILVDALLLLLAGVFFAVQPLCRMRTICGTVLTCFAAALVAGVLPGMSAVGRLEAMRREFPIVSLDDRLSYEGEADPAPAPATGGVLVELVSFEQQLDGRTGRQHELELIHRRNYENFVRSIGFGVGRMARPVPDELRRPLRNIAFDEAPASKSSASYTVWQALREAGQGSELKHLHSVSRLDFLDPESYGAILEPRSRVIGFVEHGFDYPARTGLEDQEAWIVERLELVSLLRFEEPRVYVLDHLPRMDQLSADNVRTRALDVFEASALTQLYAEEDLVVAEEAGNFRMLASLRAAEQCLDCHNASRGQLLGAFSYVLRHGREYKLAERERERPERLWVNRQ